MFCNVSDWTEMCGLAAVWQSGRLSAPGGLGLEAREARAVPKLGHWGSSLLEDHLMTAASYGRCLQARNMPAQGQRKPVSHQPPARRQAAGRPAGFSASERIAAPLATLTAPYSDAKPNQGSWGFQRAAAIRPCCHVWTRHRSPCGGDHHRLPPFPPTPTPSCDSPGIPPRPCSPPTPRIHRIWFSSPLNLALARDMPVSLCQ